MGLNCHSPVLQHPLIHLQFAKAEFLFWRQEGPLWTLVPLPSASDNTGFQPVMPALH